jgi:hypothetical protein
VRAASVNYTYDGDGKRVEKSSGTYYWRDTSGTVLAEANTSGTTLNEYIYFNGARTALRNASSGNVYYYFSDQVGTTQLMTNSAGTVGYDSDSTPFGYQMGEERCQERVKKLTRIHGCGNWSEAEWKYERKHSGCSSTFGCGRSASTGDADD